MAYRKEEANADRPLVRLHQLTRYVVDGGDVIGINGAAQAERPRQQGCAQQDGKVAKAGKRPNPGYDIEGVTVE